MRLGLRQRYEDLDLSPGQGRITAALTVALGVLSVMGAFCFLLPEVFTTPDFRALYHRETLKVVLYVAIAVTFASGWHSTMRNPHTRYGITGMLLAVFAALVGSGRIVAPEIDTRGLYVGLDYFVLTLLLLAMVFIPLERAFPKDPDQKVMRRGWITDVKYFAFSHMALQLISFFTIIPIQVVLADTTSWGFREWVAAQPLWLQFIAILVVVDFFTYWTHRAMHEVPAFWRVHAVHHSSEHMDWLASSRLHVIEILVNRAVGFVPIFVLGFAPNALYAYLVFVSFHAIFIHANVRFRFPVLRWVLATPQFHHWHHSSEAPAIDKNYAAFLPVYDWIFRTSYQPDTDAQRYGTVAGDVPEGMWGQFLYPFRKGHARGG